MYVLCINVLLGITVCNVNELDSGTLCYLNIPPFLESLGLLVEKSAAQ